MIFSVKNQGSGRLVRISNPDSHEVRRKLALVSSIIRQVDCSPGFSTGTNCFSFSLVTTALAASTASLKCWDSYQLSLTNRQLFTRTTFRLRSKGELKQAISLIIIQLRPLPNYRHHTVYPAGGRSGRIIQPLLVFGIRPNTDMASRISGYREFRISG